MAVQRTCTMTVEVDGTADVKVLQFMHMLPESTLELRLSAAGAERCQSGFSRERCSCRP